MLLQSEAVRPAGIASGEVRCCVLPGRVLTFKPWARDGTSPVLRNIPSANEAKRNLEFRRLAGFMGLVLILKLAWVINPTRPTPAGEQNFARKLRVRAQPMGVNGFLEVS